MSRWRKERFCVKCDEQLHCGEKMRRDGCCLYCGHLSEGTICDTVERAVEVKPGPVRVAWTIWKLKVVRFLLRPLLRLHIWWETRHQRKVMPAHTEGSISREAIKQAVARVKKGRLADPECICGLITPNSAACKCGCGYCCPKKGGS